MAQVMDTNAETYKIIAAQESGFVTLIPAVYFVSLLVSVS